jgi:ABC-type multidrug transport system fused ATPase/permease subunit
VLLANLGLADVLWSMVSFFFLLIWIMVLFQILADLFRDQSLSGVAKTLWVVVLLFVPFLAVFVYLITRGSGMAERTAAVQRAAQAEFDGYVQSVAGTASPTEQIAQAKQLLDAGAIDQAEYEQLKAKALA